MTNDEAIKVLSNISTVGRLNGKHLIIKALHMAIEALEHLNNIEAYMHDFDVTEEEAIKALERKKGKWLFGKNIDGAYDVYGIKSGAILLRCSKCNFAHAFIDGHSSQYHYCPNCGAEMRGEDDE